MTYPDTIKRVIREFPPRWIALRTILSYRAPIPWAVLGGVVLILIGSPTLSAYMLTSLWTFTLFTFAILHVYLKWRLAIHEAGHTIIAYHKANFLHVWITESKGSAIFITNSDKVELMASLGGMAAEHLEFSHFETATMREDLRKARISAGGLKDPGVAEGHIPIDFSKFYKSPLTDKEKNNLIHAYMEVFLMLERDQKRLREIACSLLTDGSMGYDKVKDIFNRG